jgi:hypothetical protein
MKTKIINLFAGPGAGKSSTTYILAGILKWKGYNCELVTEYAKDLTWQKSYSVLDNQMYVFAKQYQRMYRVKDKVDIIVTDSPLLLSLYYQKNESESFFDLILSKHNEFNNYNFFIKRKKPYSTIGRNQTEEEAKIIDNDLKKILNQNNIKFINIDGKINNYKKIIKIIKKG